MMTSGAPSSKAPRHWAMFTAKRSATALYGSGPFAVRLLILCLLKIFALDWQPSDFRNRNGPLALGKSVN